MMLFPDRHAISRAWFFLNKANECPGDSRGEFEAYLESCIIFARAAIHRVKTQFEHHQDWALWWKSLLSNPSVEFFRVERDWILKEAPPKIDQVIRLGGHHATKAAELYYYENPNISAADTVERHLIELQKIILDAEQRFSP